MKTRQVLPYLGALLLLAWMLGSLVQSGTGGTSILSSSYWLVYAAYLIPFLALGAMAVMTLYLALSWKMVSDALGFGLAKKRRVGGKKNRKVQIVVTAGFWIVAIGVLYWKCGGIFCDQTRLLPETVENTVQNGGPTETPFLAVLKAPALALAEIIGSEWFTFTFFTLLIVSSVIAVRSLKVAMDEIRMEKPPVETVREQGTMAVEEALKMLEMEEAADPRTRIMSCYQKMIDAAAGLGADVSVDQTARELETGIRLTFRLKGTGIADLTQLFEEARYSLHQITEADSQQAQVCLSEIGHELRATAHVEN